MDGHAFKPTPRAELFPQTHPNARAAGNTPSHPLGRSDAGPAPKGRHRCAFPLCPGPTAHVSATARANGSCRCLRRNASGLPGPPAPTQRVWGPLWKKTPGESP